MKKYAVIVAGGVGIRMGTALPKQFLLLRNKPLLWHTLTAFLTSFNDIGIVLVLPSAYITVGADIIKQTPDPARIQITAGGDTRYQSVKNGLQLVSADSIVFVHDAVRCLVTPNLIKRCYEAALDKGNAVPATRATDSLRMETATSSEVVDRNLIRLVQTPQTFSAALLLHAFTQEFEPSFTDEATVVERTGVAIHLVEGEPTNIKITTPVDLLIAEQVLEGRR